MTLIFFSVTLFVRCVNKSSYIYIGVSDANICTSIHETRIRSKFAKELLTLACLVLSVLSDSLTVENTWLLMPCVACIHRNHFQIQSETRVHVFVTAFPLTHTHTHKVTNKSNQNYQEVWEYKNKITAYIKFKIKADTKMKDNAHIFSS